MGGHGAWQLATHAVGREALGVVAQASWIRKEYVVIAPSTEPTLLCDLQGSNS